MFIASKVNIEGSGPASPIIAIADGVGRVRGVVNNPKSDPPLKPNGKLDVSTVVGAGEYAKLSFLISKICTLINYYYYYQLIIITQINKYKMFNVTKCFA